MNVSVKQKCLVGLIIAGALLPSAFAGIWVTGQNSNGELVNFAESPQIDFVHFTGTASNLYSSTLATLNAMGIPDTSVVQGTAFRNFTNSYSNLGLARGEISVSDNPFANVIYHGQGQPASNSRLWFGGWGSTDTAGLEVLLPYSEGKLEVYVGGYAGGVNGGGRLTAEIGGLQSTAALFPSDEGDFGGHWGGVFTVFWQSEIPNSLLSISLANIPEWDGGNTGLIAVRVVPEPAVAGFLGVAALCLGLRRKHRGNG